MNVVNVLHAAWKATPSGETEAKFIAGLTRYAHAIAWLILHQHRADIANEAVYRAMSRYASFKGDSAFGTWFYAVAKAVCLNTLEREAKYDREEALNDTLQDTSVQTIDAINTRLDLAKLLNTLPPLEQELIRLRLMGYTIQETADKLKLTAKAAGHRYTRAVETLRLKRTENARTQ